MSSIASEADIENLVIDVCAANGWKYRPAGGIGRPERSVFPSCPELTANSDSNWKFIR